jgi:hypothetical protein
MRSIGTDTTGYDTKELKKQRTKKQRNKDAHQRSGTAAHPYRSRSQRTNVRKDAWWEGVTKKANPEFNRRLTYVEEVKTGWPIKYVAAGASDVMARRQRTRIGPDRNVHRLHHWTAPRTHRWVRRTRIVLWRRT